MAKRRTLQGLYGVEYSRSMLKPRLHTYQFSHQPDVASYMKHGPKLSCFNEIPACVDVQKPDCFHVMLAYPLSIRTLSSKHAAEYLATHA